MREKLIETYLDYINNYLSIEKYSEHNKLSKAHGEALIKLAYSVFNSNHPES